MKHREIYMALLAPSLRDRLLATLEAEGILTATIRKAVRRSANHHGRKVFGAKTHERIQQVNAQSSLKLLVQFLQKRAG